MKDKVKESKQGTLSKPEQAAIDSQKTQTKNDGSHIEKQRADRLAKHRKGEQ